jgi:PAS domain S-box-containing protein
MHDLNGKILAWNRGAKETYGYTEAEALEMNVRDIVAEPDRDAALRLIQRIKQGDIVKSFELRRITKDGRILDVWLTTTLLSDEKGKPVAIATTERDITDRNKAETALKEKLEDLSRLATVVSDSNDAVIMHDLEGKILAWNRGAKETYGYTEAEALEMNVRDIVAETDREAALRLIQRIKEGEIVKSFELRRVTKDGRILDVWLTTTLLTDEKGKPVAIATTERDVTDRNKAEDKLKIAKEELEIKVQERTRELTQTTEDLKRAIRVKSDFLSNMSHELRTPLNSIIGFTEVLQDEMFGVLTNKQREYLGFMEKSSRHLLSLINDILDISKIEAGKMEMEYGPVAIRSLVEGSLVMFMEKAIKHSIALTVLVSTNADITIQADERKFKQMLYNLLSNAVKFTPDGGKVGVRAERSGDMVELCVEDTGIGIAADQMATLFTRFGQLEGAYDKKYEGTGLGLSLVKELAVLHGGFTRVESEPGKGSRFFVTIPVGRLTEKPRNEKTA